MMSEAKKRVPKRRFKEFLNAGDWEQRKLGDCMNSFAYGLNAAAKDYDGMHKYIRITDIDDETHNFIQSNLTSPDIDFNIDVSDYKLNVGDIVFARTGASVGKTYLYNPNDGDLYYAGFLIRGKVKEDCDAGFIYQNTLTKEYDSFIRITSQRSGQPGVNSKEYATFRLNIPCKDEQEKISKVLNSLDELFTLHQRKLDKLQATKKALLQEMFPEEGQDKPRRRFKGFTDTWEQRKLGDCMNSFAYGLNAAAKDYDGMHKYIRITDIDDETHNFIQSNLTSPDIDFNIDVSDYKLNVGDIVFARTGASVGKTYLYNPNDGDLYYAGFLIRGKVKEDCDAGFIYQNTLTKEYDSFIRITSQRSGQPGVNSKEYATFRLNIPCKDEQEKISKVLNSLDELFTLHQRKLDKLKNLKQAYLNEMFV